MERSMEVGAGDAAATAIASETPAQAEITAVKTRIAELNRRDAEVLEQIERGREQRDEVRLRSPRPKPSSMHWLQRRSPLDRIRLRGYRTSC
jgi:hypothetical protein